MYLTTLARDRKRAQALRFDADDVPAAPVDHWDADDDEAQCSDEDKPDAAVNVPPEDHSLNSMYAAMSMLESRTETVLFDRDSGAMPDHEHEAELRRELNSAFAGCLANHVWTSEPESSQLMHQIAYLSNYEVVQIARVMNRTQYRMQLTSRAQRAGAQLARHHARHALNQRRRRVQRQSQRHSTRSSRRRRRRRGFTPCVLGARLGRRERRRRVQKRGLA
jgi:hypothetical protein